MTSMIRGVVYWLCLIPKVLAGAERFVMYTCIKNNMSGDTDITRDRPEIDLR